MGLNHSNLHLGISKLLIECIIKCVSLDRVMTDPNEVWKSQAITNPDESINST